VQGTLTGDIDAFVTKVDRRPWRPPGAPRESPGVSLRPRRLAGRAT